MNRVLRSAGVLAVMLLAIGCGGGTTEEPAAPSIDLASHSPAAHIVCDAEDPCPKGFICLGHIRCAQVCKSDSDCPSGQLCSGSINGKKFCQ
jgi:Cys-rich repeat protein